MAVDAPNGTMLAHGFDWEEVKYPARLVSTFATLSYGKSLVEGKRQPGKVPMYGTNGQCGWNATSLVEGPGVILGRKGQGHLGVKWCAVPFWVIDTAYYAQINREDVDLRWFYYITKYVGLDHLKTGEKPGLSRDIFGRQLFPFPKRGQQEAIARILATLDDKIELNRQMNQTLEALARAIFRSWFVDFDPVVAKAAGRQPVGMNAETARLFPSELEDSVFGKKPMAWRIARLGEHLEAMKGLSYKGKGLSDSGLPLHNLNSVLEGGGYKYAGIKYYVGEYADRHLIRPGDVIVANTEQGHDCLLLGYAAIVPNAFAREAIYSHHLFRVRVRERSQFSADFVCHLLNTELMHDTVSGYGNGTTVNMLPLDALEKPEFIQPPDELVAKFSQIARDFRERSETLVVQNRTLGALRDALLPRLLSGELRVSAAKKTVEAT